MQHMLMHEGGAHLEGTCLLKPRITLRSTVGMLRP